MRVETFIEALQCDFYTGVPDSQLKALCDYLMLRYGSDPKHHIIGVNEGNCVAIASGYYLATGKIPVVYMQNSGEGNAINPIASLLNEEVYGIPMIFVVGWRGEPGAHDEPQHIYQGKVTLKLLEDMDIEYAVVGKDTTEEALRAAIRQFQERLAGGKSVAFVIRKGALENEESVSYANPHSLCRETAIAHILRHTGQDPVISTTGKISRELYEIREKNGEGHQHDFLTVGSMGHSSSIALGIALHKPEKRVWCIDGDGAMLMHLGAAAILGTCAPKNLIHICLNNEAHETVGGMPTAAGRVKLMEIAKACGYEHTACVEDEEALDRVLQEAKARTSLIFIEVKCALSSRSDLGRPTITPKESKRQFMKALEGEEELS